VVGVGRLGGIHARILSQMEGVTLVGVHDSDLTRAQEVANEYGCRALATPEPVFAECDAVVVAVPTTDHHSVTVAALQAGCHTLVEKPLAPSLDEADDMIAHAQAANRLLAVGHVERFNPIIRASRGLVQNPRFLSCIRLARFQPRGTDVAVTLDLMIHDIDLVLGLVDSPVSSFQAIGVPLITGTVDMANARLTFENGAIADVSASRVSAQPTRQLRVFQESGYLSLDLAAGRGEFLRRRMPPRLSADPAEASLADFVERTELHGDGSEPLRVELEAFVEAIAGKTSGIVTGPEGRDALAVALNISRQIERSHHAIAPDS
jgi:predicted dehydrogenase